MFGVSSVTTIISKQRPDVKRKAVKMRFFQAFLHANSLECGFGAVLDSSRVASEAF